MNMAEFTVTLLGPPPEKATGGKAGLQKYMEEVLTDIQTGLASRGLGEEKFVVDYSDPNTLEIKLETSSRVAAALAQNRNVDEVIERPALPSMQQQTQHLRRPDAKGTTRMSRVREATPDLRGLFIVALGAIQGMRLRLERKVIVHVEDLHTLLHEARRLVETNKFTEAFDRCDRVHTGLEERVKKWEREAKNRLSVMKGKRQMGKLEQLKNEIADVYRQSQGALIPLMRLRNALETLARQASGKAQ